MALVAIDPKNIKFDAEPQGFSNALANPQVGGNSDFLSIVAPQTQPTGLVKVDPTQIKFDAQPVEYGNDKGRTQSFVQGFNQTVPFGNRITASLAAAALSPFAPEGITTSDLYRQARDDQKVTENTHSGYNLAGGLAGIAATLPIGISKAVSTTPVLGPVANGLSKTSGAINSFVGNAATKGGKALRSAVVAAPAGAVYGYGSGEEGNRLESAAETAGLSAALGGSLPLAVDAVKGAVSTGRNIATGFGARADDALDGSYQAIKDRASQAYKTMRDSGATLKADAASKLVNDVEKSFYNDGVVNNRLHGKVVGLLEDLKADAANPNFSIENLDQWRQLFGEVAGDFGDKINSRKASIVIGKIDDAIDSISPQDLQNGSTEAIDALKYGRQEYGRSRRFEAVSELIQKSDGDANHLKRSLRSFLDNPKKTRGWSEDELSALKEAASLSNTEGILKLVGKFGFDAGNSRVGSGVGALVGSVTAGASGGGLPGAVIAPVVGTASRYGQKLAARGKAENLLRTIERGGSKAQKAAEEVQSQLPQNITLQQLMELPPAQAIEILKNNGVK